MNRAIACKSPGVCYRAGSWLALGVALALNSPVLHALSEEEAVQRVKTQACRGSLAVADVLDQAMHNRSQRDLGWRVFPGDGFVDVERAVLINKGMELRYRWRVDRQGAIGPENERAERLCEDP